MGSGCNAVAVTGVCLELSKVIILDQDWGKGGKEAYCLRTMKHANIEIPKK